jgi:hypothetical protein
MIDWEQAFDMIVDHLRSCPDPTKSATQAPAMMGCDLYLPALVPAVAIRVGDRAFEYRGDNQNVVRWYLPFQDAAAELCRIGVLRLGERTPTGSFAQPGSGYSLTAFGRTWVASKPESAPRDPARLLAVVQPFARRFRRWLPSTKCRSGRMLLAGRTRAVDLAPGPPPMPPRRACRAHVLGLLGDPAVIGRSRA